MLRLKKISINNEEYDLGSINIILGHNNSGKSTLLAEIFQALTSNDIKDSLWLDYITTKIIDPKKDIERLIPDLFLDNEFQSEKLGKLGLQNIFSINHWSPSVFNYFKKIAKGEIFDNQITKDNVRDEKSFFDAFFYGLRTKFEGCRERLNPTLNTRIDRLDSPYTNLIHFLYLNPDLFKEIREYIRNTFDIELTFDDIRQPEIALRITPSRKPTREEKQNIKKYLKYWRENSKLIANQGDGIHAYLKLCLSLFDRSKDVFLIDEPETFLHPPQRRSIAEFIAKKATANKQVFIATHDAEILRGILLGSVDDIKLFNIKESAGTREVNYIDFQRDSLSSRSYNEKVLNSFFHRLTVICEAEDDRLIYEYAAKKYYPTKFSDIQFIGTNGKSESYNNIVLLRNLGLSACVIYDIDALYSKEILSKGFFTDNNDPLRLKIQSIQKDLIRMLKNDPLRESMSEDLKKDFKAYGIESYVVTSIKSELSDVINGLKLKGIFIVPKGTLESWFVIPESSSKKIQSAMNIIDTKRNSELKIFLRDVVGYF